MSMLEATPDTQPASPGRMTTQLLRLAIQANDDCLGRFRRLAADLADEAQRVGDGDDYNDGRMSGLADASIAIYRLLGDRD